MKIQDILAIATLGIVGGNITEKKRKEKKKKDTDCCPKCGSRRIQMKKGNKFRCLDCGRESYCAREVYIETNGE